MDKMPPPPKPPPGNFNQQALLITAFPAGFAWFRLHRKEHPPDFFGKTGAGRFDSPHGGFGSLYIAVEPSGAFVEVFCRQSVRAATVKRLNAFHVAQFNTDRALKLVDLTGPGPVKMGLGDARPASGNYKIAQQWSQAFHDHPRKPDGLLYRSRHDPDQQLAAIFSRTQPIWNYRPLGTLKDYLGEHDFFNLLKRYGFGILP